MDNIDHRQLPSAAWDSHVHVFDPANYPYSPSRAYTPEPATFASRLGFNRNLTAHNTSTNIVLVQPSPYGTDNSAIEDLPRKHIAYGDNHKQDLRGTVVFTTDNVSEQQVSTWNALRVNTESGGNATDGYTELIRTIRKTAEKGQESQELGMPAVYWRRGLGSGEDPLTQPGFSTLLRLAKTGKVFIKISGFYRSSKLTSGGYDDLEPIVKKFVEEMLEQLIWGSAWPHTGSGTNRTEAKKYTPEKFRVVDDAAVLQNIKT
ncbi:hypothetical protein BDV96DRAFT_642625 [Lophiotrema nucula]|uniref:Amidohydrolase-related domain-containing protein n=1 Tax=Lophiotrema nucula TaxID=690887 RepID=A0A6A5ZMD2_9PLEO|nr:hypothetical protein BDV96DRAFT_642625 [Lophiotrema nucula]